MNYFFGTSDKSKSDEKVDEKSSSSKSTLERKLRVRIGASLNSLTTYKVNDDRNPHFIDSPHFIGNITVRIKNFNGINPDPTSQPISDIKYFGKKKRLFSIQLSGRFKQEHTVDDVVFGAEFEQKVSPPSGAWLALKFANLIDPALQAEIYGDKPWLFSPMMCSMNVVNVEKCDVPASVVVHASDKASVSSKSSRLLLADEVSKALTDIKSTPPVSKVLSDWVWGGENDLVEENELLFNTQVNFATDNIAERRKYFQSKSNRQETTFKTDRIYHLEIFAPFIDLNMFDLTLGINVNLVRYLNKQPIRLSAKSLSKNTTFFIIEFDLIDENGMGLGNSNIDSPVENDLEFELPIEAGISESEEELTQRAKDMALGTA